MANIDLNAPFAAQLANDNNSKKDYFYETDDGQLVYAGKLNENYAELLGFQSTLGVGETLTEDFKVTKFRTITYSDGQNINGTLRVGNPRAPIYSEGGQVTIPRKGKAAGVVCNVIGSQGEKKIFLNARIAQDGGQLSGDNP